MGRDLDAASVRTWILHKHKLASVNLSTLTSYAGIVGNSHEEKHRVALMVECRFSHCDVIYRYILHSTLVKFLPDSTLIIL